jgi:adenine deaminase
LASLPLPLAGLLTGQDAATTRALLDQLNRSLHTVGVSTGFNPFLTLSFMALPVIPELKITDLGLFDVRAFQHIPIEAMQ